MKTLVSFFLTLIVGCSAALAQYVCTDKGAAFDYKTVAKVDGNDKTATVKAVIDSVSEANGLVTVRVKSIATNPDDEFAELVTYTTVIYNPSTDVTDWKVMSADEYKRSITDMVVEQARMSGRTLSKSDLETLDSEIKIKGELSLLVQSDPDPTAKIPNKSIKIMMGPVTMSMNLWDVKYLGKETVTVPAGTFEDCVKISYLLKVNTPEATEKSYTTSWFAKGIGEIKNVVTDKKGNVLSSQELVSMSK